MEVMGEPTHRRRFGVLISNLRKEEANGQDRGIRTSEQPKKKLYRRVYPIGKHSLTCSAPFAPPILDYWLSPTG